MISNYCKKCDPELAYLPREIGKPNKFWMYHASIMRRNQWYALVRWLKDRLLNNFLSIFGTVGTKEHLSSIIMWVLFSSGCFLNNIADKVNLVHKAYKQEAGCKELGCYVDKCVSYEDSQPWVSVQNMTQHELSSLPQPHWKEEVGY